MAPWPALITNWPGRPDFRILGAAVGAPRTSRYLTSGIDRALASRHTGAAMRLHTFLLLVTAAAACGPPARDPDGLQTSPDAPGAPPDASLPSGYDEWVAMCAKNHGDQI